MNFRQCREVAGTAYLLVAADYIKEPKLIAIILAQFRKSQ